MITTMLLLLLLLIMMILKMMMNDNDGDGGGGGDDDSDDDSDDDDNDDVYYENDDDDDSAAAVADGNNAGVNYIVLMVLLQSKIEMVEMEPWRDNAKVYAYSKLYFATRRRTAPHASIHPLHFFLQRFTCSIVLKKNRFLRMCIPY
ncbi:halomucin [Elysia marginata]|uniref:Halomucin n=1 Tax=Elysia marginata TaxID=1093978 RepID=A0AAV4FZL1_9GAST|nr:halomucin [Elysia marginata]